jgi:hypothetical protein
VSYTVRFKPTLVGSFGASETRRRRRLRRRRRIRRPISSGKSQRQKIWWSVPWESRGGVDAGRRLRRLSHPEAAAVKKSWKSPPSPLPVPTDRRDVIRERDSLGQHRQRRRQGEGMGGVDTAFSRPPPLCDEMGPLSMVMNRRSNVGGAGFFSGGADDDAKEDDQHD